VLGEEDRAVRRDQAGGVEEVLDRELDARAAGVGSGEKDPFEQAQATAM
jgi:hypothetical protein